SDRVGGSPRDLGRDDGRRGTRPGGRPMTPPDGYLEQVRRAMSGMEPGVRDDILRELRSHIAESTAANGGNVNASLAAVGSAEEVGRHYRELYGYGRAYKTRFAAFGIAAITLVGAETTANGLGLLIVVSVMLVVLGWIPGTAKKAWSAPRAQL